MPESVSDSVQIKCEIQLEKVLLVALKEFSKRIRLKLLPAQLQRSFATYCIMNAFILLSLMRLSIQNLLFPIKIICRTFHHSQYCFLFATIATVPTVEKSDSMKRECCTNVNNFSIWKQLSVLTRLFLGLREFNFNLRTDLHGFEFPFRLM